MRIVQEHNYRPNLAARSLVTHETHVLSVVIPQAIASTFIDPYFPVLLQGIMHEARACDYAVMLWVGDDIEDEERFCDRVLSNTLFDGVLVASAIVNDPLMSRLSAANYPSVVIGPPLTSHFNYVDVDNLRGAQLATAHLIRLGHERIGTIAGPQNMPAAQNRLRGFRQAFETARRPVIETLVVEGNFTHDAGYWNMKRLLQRGLDAVFVASDTMALGALTAIQEEGLRVPDDISLVSFDDLPVAATTRPPLTTVRQPIQEMGALAIKALINLLDGDLQTPYQVLLPVELVVRESCGATRLL